MNIGEAVSALKSGKWIRRAGWNGKGMHVYLEEHQNLRMPRINGKTGKVIYEDVGRCHAPFMVLYTGSGNHQPGWNASTPDVLSEDWEVVPDSEMA